MPLINTSGNLTRVDNIMILEGAFVGGVDNIKPKDEKQAPARIIPNTRIIGYSLGQMHIFLELGFEELIVRILENDSINLFKKQIINYYISKYLLSGYIRNQLLNFEKIYYD